MAQVGKKTKAVAKQKNSKPKAAKPKEVNPKNTKSKNAKDKKAEPLHLDDIPEEVRPILFDAVGNQFLSPLAVSHFERDGVTYNCIHQFYYAAEAAYYEDVFTHNNIMTTEEPDMLPIARVGLDSILTGDDEWIANKDKVMATAIRLMYEESDKPDSLRNLLVATGDRPLVFASDDKHWGIGMSLAQAKKEYGMWSGKNKFGKLLEFQRRKLVVGQPARVQTKISQEQDDRMLLDGVQLEDDIVAPVTMGNSFENDFMQTC